jgi:hypothetical protein
VIEYSKKICDTVEMYLFVYENEEEEEGKKN